MFFQYRSWAVLAVVIHVVCLSACAPTSLLDVPMDEFGLDSVPLPEDWEKRRDSANDKRMEEFGASESRGQHWAPVESEKGGFGFDVYEFESVASAKEGYRIALHLLRKPGFTLDPPAGYRYTSSFADQYTVFCGSPETTPGFCNSVARYANFVVTTGLTPGDGVTLEQLPELFATVDRHVKTVIEDANKE